MPPRLPSSIWACSTRLIPAVKPTPARAFSAVAPQQQESDRSHQPPTIARTFTRARQDNKTTDFTSTLHHNRRNEVLSGLSEKLGEMDKAKLAASLQPLDEFVSADAQRMQLYFEWGDTYAPNDLSMEERLARQKNRRPTRDAFDVLGINPIDEYKNVSLLGEYVTSMGRIKHSSQTGLRPVNQRRIAKAIRRAVGIGLLPSVHRHPEVLKRVERSHRYPGGRSRY